MLLLILSMWIWGMWAMAPVAGSSIITYSIEVTLKDSDGYDLWPIICEYDDPHAFKAGNLSRISNTRTYVNFILTQYGELKTSGGNSTGFNKRGDFGINSANSSDIVGFKIVDDALYFKDAQNWTACPFERNDKLLYTIQYNSNCTGGYRTNLTVVGQDSLTTLSHISSLTHVDFDPTTTLSDNSFQSFTDDDSSSSFAYTSTINVILVAIGVVLLTIITVV